PGGSIYIDEDGTVTVGRRYEKAGTPYYGPLPTPGSSMPLTRQAYLNAVAGDYQAGTIFQGPPDHTQKPSAFVFDRPRAIYPLGRPVLAVNSLGQVLTDGSDLLRPHGWVFDARDGTEKGLPLLGLGINDAGTIVGTFDSGGGRALLYDGVNPRVDLNDLVG